MADFDVRRRVSDLRCGQWLGIPVLSLKYDHCGIPGNKSTGCTMANHTDFDD